jgi:hypothetical protein
MRRNQLKNILYCEKYSLTFISNPKVACSTIKNSLLDGFEGDVHGEAAARFSGSPNKDHDFFCITRNPYSRVLSCFKNKIGHGKEINPKNVWHPFCRRFNIDPQSQPTLKDFLNLLAQDEHPETFDMHYRCQHINLHSKYIKPAYIGRIENFENIEQYLAKYSIKILTRNRHKTGSLTTYKSDIRPDEAALITEIYKQDFDIYGYSYELLSEFIPKPSYQKQWISEEYISAFIN